MKNNIELLIVQEGAAAKKDEKDEAGPIKNTTEFPAVQEGGAAKEEEKVGIDM